MAAAQLIPFNSKSDRGQQVIADTDDGYTRVANQIYDQMGRLDLTGAQHQVLNVIIRITYGYNQKTNRITNTYVAQLTGLTEKAVRLSLIELHSRNIIHLEKSGLMKTVGINKVISDWVVTKGKSEKQSAKGKQSRNNGSNLTRNNGSTETEQRFLEGGTTVPDSRNCSSSTKENNKDNLLNTTSKEGKSPPMADDSALREGAVIQVGKNWGEQVDLDTVNAILPVLQNTLADHYRAPNLAAWANEIRLMRQQDKRTPEHIAVLFKIAHTDDFWKANIQSPAALRKHWGRIAALHNSRRNGLTNGQHGITQGSGGSVMTAEDWGDIYRSKGDGVQGGSNGNS